MRRSGSFIVATALAAALLAPGSAPAAPRDRGGPTAGVDVYVATVDLDQVADVVASGVERRELVIREAAGGKQVRVEVPLSALQARRLRAQGIDLGLKRIDGQSVAERSTAMAAEGFEVWRRYSGADGLRAQFREMAASHPRITELQTIGKTVQGRPIVALRVTRDARKVRDGKRPAVLYLAAQHAREWITPEMVRRLALHVLEGYGKDAELTRLVDRRELWFVPVANPDGYDLTFEPGQRLWRKNLRDNNGNGVVDAGDGVDLNRNFPTRWGYDNEGSSPDPASDTYRGPRPASEPESKALIGLARRVGFEFLVNYHSAAELLLYGTGWQVATASPDDVIYEAMAGDDAQPAVPGYDPDVSAELYTTNGDTDTHITEAFGTLGFTPEMSTCEAASAVDPDDPWLPEDCGSGFEFPDDPVLVQQEFEKNLPFALSVARSAADPDDPDSAVGRTAEDFRVDTFDVSYGTPQEVAVVAKRALRDVRMHYRVDGGPVKVTRVRPWSGGERYGDENDVYYRELRGTVRGARPGDRVQVWFSGKEKGERRSASDRFGYTVESDTEHDVLVIANEDYTGVDPDYPPEVTAPKYAEQYVDAVEASGRTADVWDVDADGVPHDLGVLSHYDAVVWYLGDNRLTQDPEDVETESPLGPLPDTAVAERQQYLTLAVRDYLNEGGKLVHVGESTQHQGLEGISDDLVGGLYYGLNGDPTADCVISDRPTGSLEGLFDDCLILADDFRQYWLGGYRRTSFADAVGVEGVRHPFLGFAGEFGGAGATPDNPLDEAGHFTVTSDVLPPSQFPQFRSRGTLSFTTDVGALPFEPVEGERYAGALHQDGSYMRLTRTATIPDGAGAASLDLQVSAATEAGYDHLVVEARPAGTEEWTTLPEAGGLTSSTSPAECEDDPFLLDLHPFLTHYLDAETCTSPGSSGEWNSITGSTDGWQQASYDLTGFAGEEVELSISYVTDPFSGAVGAFVDDTRLVVDGAVVDADGFEDATSDWTAAGAPEGSPGNAGDWQIAGRLVFQHAGTSTADTLLAGFGLEQLASDAERVAFMERALGGLLR